MIIHGSVFHVQVQMVGRKNLKKADKKKANMSQEIKTDKKS